MFLRYALPAQLACSCWKHLLLRMQALWKLLECGVPALPLLRQASRAFLASSPYRTWL